MGITFRTDLISYLLTEIVHGLLKDRFIFEYLPVCMYAHCVPGTRRGQKRALGPLELELRVVVSHDTAAGN